MWTVNFQMFKLVLQKAEEPEIKLPTSTGSWKKEENSRKTSISALLTMPKPLTVWITINCGKFWKRWEYQTTLTCLLRNLYAGQEATVRTGHGTTDWFQRGKGVHQGCILSPCFFNCISSSRANIRDWVVFFCLWFGLYFSVLAYCIWQWRIFNKFLVNWILEGISL